MEGIKQSPEQAGTSVYCYQTCRNDLTLSVSRESSLIVGGMIVGVFTGEERAGLLSGTRCATRGREKCRVAVVAMETWSGDSQTMTVPPPQGAATRRPTTSTRNEQGGRRGPGGGRLRWAARVMDQG